MGKAGIVSRLDALCYDNTKTQVESGRAKDLGGIPNNPRPDEVCYDIENAQVNCADVV